MIQLTRMDRDKIAAVHKELTDNFFTWVLIDDLCTKYNISKPKLSKGFKRIYDITIYRYHMERSMGYAKDRLAKGARINDLVEILNYSSNGTFSRAFKNVYGMNPVECRFE